MDGVHAQMIGDQIATAIENAGTQPRPKVALMCDPSGFRVEYVINPHMAEADGSPRKVDKKLAMEQWQELHDAYEAAGCTTSVVSADMDYPDQVFTANHGVAYLDPDGVRSFAPARMANAEREGEVPITTAHMQKIGYSITPLQKELRNEGGGDVLWLADRKVMLGGYGFRSDRESIFENATLAGVPMIDLELVDPRFYHLDTCLTVINQETAMWVPTAFTSAGRQILEDIFTTLIQPPMDEAEMLAANAHSPDGKRVIIEKRCKSAISALEEHGFDTVPVGTSEFGKSGGSVTCMRHMIW